MEEAGTYRQFLIDYRHIDPLFNGMTLVKFKGYKFATDWRKSFPWCGDHGKNTIYQKISQKKSVDAF